MKKTFPYSIKLRLPFLLMLLFMTAATQAAEVLSSPNGKYQFVFSQKDGKLTYRLDYADKKVVEEGELGVNIDNHLVESAMGILSALFPVTPWMSLNTPVRPILR